MNKLAIIAISLITAFAGISPAAAFPVQTPPIVQNSDVVNVQYSEYRHRGRHHGDRGRYQRRGYDRHGDRGYRNHRRHNNTGAIIGGLAAGAIIGGIVAGSRNNSSHAQSCANRYRTYRASDNTYQPNSGPRVQCR